MLVRLGKIDKNKRILFHSRWGEKPSIGGPTVPGFIQSFSPQFRQKTSLEKALDSFSSQGTKSHHRRLFWILVNLSDWWCHSPPTPTEPLASCELKGISCSYSTHTASHGVKCRKMIIIVAINLESQDPSSRGMEK